MYTKLRLVLSITILFLSFYGSAQTAYWKQEASGVAIQSASLQNLDVQKAQFFTLKEKDLSKELLNVSRAGKKGNILYFPNDKGKLMAFRVVETPIMAPELAAKYPNIKSYTGYSLNGKDRIRFSNSHNGLQAMIIPSGDKATVFMQRTSNTENTYAIYSRDQNGPLVDDFICETKAETSKQNRASTSKLVDDQILRKFRIAVSATGEYTAFHGGTVADALAAINATLTRVNEVFETDLGVTLELVANTDQVIFTDGATDPYGGNLNTQVQNTLSANIGEANYDVGHLFHEAGNNGNAGFIGSVCKDNQKGSAFSAGSNPQGDIFDLDFVSHELGHQFGANHTWSFETEGTQVQAEPASGTTIMGYAGIVDGNNVAPNGEDYFHYFSIVQISDYLQTVSCAEEMAMTNVPPAIVSTGDYIIPKSTAFVLTGEATDADTGDVLTYAWEQVDDGVVTTSTFGPDRPNGANFRSQRPSTSPERYFPKLSEVVQGNLTQTNPPINSAWETVSNVERDLNFALTVRDNASGGGQVASDLVKVSVKNSSGPFAVTSQNATESYSGGSTQTISWDVANTDQLPVNAQTVDIFLSTDSGTTFPFTLGQDVPNDGSHDVIIPGMVSTTARIMVKASDNIFFAVNTSDFTITESEVVLSFSDLEYEACQPNDLAIPFTYETYGGFNEQVTFNATGAPANLDITFSPTTAIANNTDVMVTFSDTDEVTAGNYPITITAASASVTKEVVLQLAVSSATFSDVVLMAPADVSEEISLNPSLEWEANNGATSYDLEIATDAAFNTIVEMASVIGTTYIPTNLNAETTYFWRVKPKNSCGEGTFGAPFSFATISVNCKTITAIGLPKTISATGTPTVTATATFVDNLPISEVNLSLDLEHNFLSDLIISLTSPAGTTIILTSNSCGDLRDINAVFNNSASNFICQGNPAINGTVKPLGSLASFKGESAFGEWTLTVVDTAPADGGVLNGFSVEICVEGELRPDADGDGVFDDGDDLCLGTPPGTEVDVDGCPIFRFPADNFVLAVESESCIANNNGSIEIMAAQTMNYSVTVNGNGVNTNADFTDDYQLNNLAAGTYTVCITGTNGGNDFEPFCFEAVVTEPQPLSVSSVVSTDVLQATLALSGSDRYFIELNGVLTQTEENEITLDLKEGINTLKVSTDLPCQGTYEESIFVSDKPIFYPNPFMERVTAFLNTSPASLDIIIHDNTGRLISSETRGLNGTSEIQLDFTGMASGMYFISLRGQGIQETYKVLKR